MARATGGRQSVRRIQDFLAQQSAVTGGRVRTTPALEAYLTAELEAEKSLSLQQEALTEQKRATAKRESLQAEQLSEQAKAAEVQGYIQAAEVTAIGSLALKELGLIGGGEAATSITATNLGATGGGAGVTSTVGATTAPELVSLGGVTGEAAGGVGVGTEVAGATGGASTAAGGSATGESASASGGGGVGLGIAAAVIGDAYIAESASGGFDTWEDRQQVNFKGLLEYGGVSPGAAATMERWGIKSPQDLTREAFGIEDDPLNQVIGQINEAVGESFLNEVNTFLQDTFGI